MAIDHETQVPAVPKSAYGRVIREQGTLKVLIVAGILVAAWVAYGTVHTNMMNQVKWPTLASEPQGLTVIGLRDRDRPGWKHRYEAIERGHAWIFRRPDDSADSGEDAGATSEEQNDRGSNPGASHRVASGEIVDIADIMKDPDIPVVLTGKCFTGASIEERTEPLLDRHYSVVTVHLSDEGRSRYWQFSNAHPKERLVFVLQGVALTCPRMDSMDVSALEIQPIWDRPDADRLANFINGRK